MAQAFPLLNPPTLGQCIMHNRTWRLEQRPAGYRTCEWSTFDIPSLLKKLPAIQHVHALVPHTNPDAHRNVIQVVSSASSRDSVLFQRHQSISLQYKSMQKLGCIKVKKLQRRRLCIFMHMPRDVLAFLRQL